MAVDQHFFALYSATTAGDKGRHFDAAMVELEKVFYSIRACPDLQRRRDEATVADQQEYMRTLTRWELPIVNPNPLLNTYWSRQRLFNKYR